MASADRRFQSMLRLKTGSRASSYEQKILGVIVVVRFILVIYGPRQTWFRTEVVLVIYLDNTPDYRFGARNIFTAPDDSTRRLKA